jgi:hypothetical protein
LRALTVKQPWAWAIATGHKDIENRGSGTLHSGLLAIHSSLTVDNGVGLASRDQSRLTACTEFDKAGGRSNLWEARYPPLPSQFAPPPNPQLALGAVIAVAELVGVCKVKGDPAECGCGPWAQPSQCHWKLADARPLTTAVHVRGWQGLWVLQGADLKAVQEALPR